MNARADSPPCSRGARRRPPLRRRPPPPPPPKPQPQQPRRPRIPEVRICPCRRRRPSSPSPPPPPRRLPGRRRYTTAPLSAACTPSSLTWAATRTSWSSLRVPSSSTSPSAVPLRRRGRGAPSRGTSRGTWSSSRGCTPDASGTDSRRRCFSPSPNASPRRTASCPSTSARRCWTSRFATPSRRGRTPSSRAERAEPPRASRRWRRSRVRLRFSSFSEGCTRRFRSERIEAAPTPIATDDWPPSLSASSARCRTCTTTLPSRATCTTCASRCSTFPDTATPTAPWLAACGTRSCPARLHLAEGTIAPRSSPRATPRARSARSSSPATSPSPSRTWR
mmetsp:Transcript_13013/g.52435  ORF Transcript_13013/g.52435 Transcript_13013/m.52435 type:complete len:336 (+) Transcript_13013:1073-2080(+)